MQWMPKQMENNLYRPENIQRNDFGISLTCLGLMSNDFVSSREIDLNHSVNGTSVDSKSLVNLTDPINV